MKKTLQECTLTDNELVEKVDEIINKLCETGGKSWTLTIPANFNNDPDLLIAELGNRLLKYQSEQMYSEEELKYKVTKSILFERKDGIYQDGDGNQITTEFLLQHNHHIHENNGIIYLK